MTPDVSPAEWAVRRDLAACYRLVAMAGWDDLLANHMTVRVPGEPGAFLINPFGLMFDEVTASSLVKIGLDGEVLAPTEHAVNRTGFVIHSAIHQARADANCVIHLHSRAGVAVSMQEGGLLPLNQTAMAICDDISFHEYEGVALDLDERERFAADLGDKHLMILRNHGILAIGRTVAEAFLRTYYLEWSCDVQLRALATGQRVHDADPLVVASVAPYGAPPAIAEFSQLVWTALLRRVARTQPDYAS